MAGLRRYVGVAAALALLAALSGCVIIAPLPHRYYRGYY